MKLTSLEICAGAGGQALGLEEAGFEPILLVELDEYCCETLKQNRPFWNVRNCDIREFDAKPYFGIDLFAGGVPCPPFSVAGKQLGSADERDLFPVALRLIEQTQPKAVLLENVRGLLDARFDDYRAHISNSVRMMGYVAEWRLLNACDYGVPQLRPRVVLAALKAELAGAFEWPSKNRKAPLTVGSALCDLVTSRGWLHASDWTVRANTVAPTIVGGSKKHGGPDLGPTRAKKAWAAIGVDGHGIADEPPDRNFEGMPRLTVRMVARLQGFPDTWCFSGGKTAAYRQVGNAFPPPVAKAVAKQMANCLLGQVPEESFPWRRLSRAQQEKLFTQAC